MANCGSPGSQGQALRLSEVLHELKLVQYAACFKDDGVVDVEELHEYSKEDLMLQFGMIKNHAQRLVIWLDTHFHREPAASSPRSPLYRGRNSAASSPTTTPRDAPLAQRSSLSKLQQDRDVAAASDTVETTPQHALANEVMVAVWQTVISRLESSPPTWFIRTQRTSRGP